MEEHERGPEPVATPEPAVAAPAATGAGPVAFSAAHGHACGCASCSPAWSPRNVLALQRGAGNAAVARSLAIRRTVARVIDDRPYNEGRQARDEWIAGGVRGPEDHVPSTGRGGFEAQYDPAGQKLTIELRGGVDFRDGMKLYFGTYAVAQQPGNGPAAAAATAINALPRAQRAAAMAPWIWDDAAKTTFLSEFESSIEQAWSAKHQFHCSKEFWTDLGAAVDVRVVVRDGAQSSDSGEHMNVVSYKESDATVASTPAHVAQTETFGSHDADDNEMVVNSTQTRRRSDIAQSVSIGFNPGTSTLTAAAVGSLNWFGNAYKSGGGPQCSQCSKPIAEAAVGAVNVSLAGEGSDATQTEASARARFTSVTAALVAGGMTDAATRCVLTISPGTGSNGSVRMGSGVQQIVAAHEAGHMFGLGDEYTAPFSGTGGDLGTPVDPGLGGAQGLPEATHENSDTIMSVGDAVRPQHYATFLEALKAVSAMPDWVMGAPVPVTPPNPALDATPGTTDPTAPVTAVA
jgi:hypothetical protein